MKAIFIERFGGPDVLTYGDFPDPVAGTGQIAIDVFAASVNGADWKVRSNAYGAQSSADKFPLILGRDFSGVVAARGEGVSDFTTGDEVFGVLEAGREGAYAEKLVISASIVAKKPAPMSHVNAAALALAGLTAIKSLEDTLHLKSGETILIQGGAGGVGSFAVQLAKHLGAHVIATARAENHAFLRELGADEIIDYTKTDFTTIGQRCDAVFDTVGGEVGQKSYTVLKPGGRAAFVASAQAPKPDRNDVTPLRPGVSRARSPLERVAALFTAGAVRAPAIKLYALQDAADAHRLSESRHFRGKLVFQVR
jgi:NADPH:quinone reductase-like Zn-dependent oxidoreductase